MHEQAPDPDREQRPRGELFTHPELGPIWAAIVALEPDQRHVLYRRLAADVAVPENARTPHERRVARAIAALTEAAALLEEAAGEPVRLSTEKYERLREEHPESGWPPGGSIRRWLGGTWNDALRRAQLEPVADGDVLVRELGPRLGRGEIVQAVRDFVAETSDQLPTLWRYVAWAKRPDIQRRPGRRPLSQGPFDRNFGGWLGALAAAGVLESSATGMARGAGGNAAPGPTSGATYYRRSGYRYTPDQIRAALREAADLIGRSPKGHEYSAARDQILETDTSAGRPLRAFPSYTLIHSRYESWDAALIDAGLQPTDGRHNKVFTRTRRSTKRISDEEILAAIRLAHGEVEGRLTIKRYQAWRRSRLSDDRAAGRYRRIPEHFCIWQRFGGWSKAVELALAPRPDERPPHRKHDEDGHE